MGRFSVGRITVALGVMLTTAAAQLPQPDQIIVQGERQRAQIDDFVAQLKPASGHAQLAKFLEPVCPEVAGLHGSQSLGVANRMRRVAEAAGVQAAPPGCTPNILVLVVPDKTAAMAELRRTRPDLLGDLPPTEFRRMANAPGGAAAWQVVDLIQTDGMRLGASGMKTGDHVEQEAVRMVQTVGSPSRLRELSVPQFLTSIVIIEADVAKDVTPTQLADYALMRAVVPTVDREAAPRQSILNLVNADRAGIAAPNSVTLWDMAFLKSLYATSNAVEASVQRDAIARRMASELREAPPQ
jgi:hypothetical protein